MSDSALETTLALFVPPEARGRLLDPNGPLSGQGVRERLAAFYLAMGFVCLIAMAKVEAEERAAAGKDGVARPLRAAGT